MISCLNKSEHDLSSIYQHVHIISMPAAKFTCKIDFLVGVGSRDEVQCTNTFIVETHENLKPSKLFRFSPASPRRGLYQQQTSHNLSYRTKQTASKSNMNPQQGSKYSHINPVYQVDFSNAASGKRLSGTKRRVRFRFGFSNAEAIAQGATGTECRGEEHEVCLVWSLTSGKRVVVADGEEVHYSKGSRTEGRFETSWTIPGGHMIKLIAHAAPPLFPIPGFRQFDLQLDGKSYFDMARIFELGKNTDRSKAQHMLKNRTATQVHSNCIVPATPSIHEVYSHEHSNYSVARDVVESSPEPPRAAPEPLTDHLEQSAPTNIDMLDSAPAPVTPSRDEFAPVAEEPSFALVSNQIMSAYAPTPSVAAAQPAVPALANESHTYYAPTPAPTPHFQPRPVQSEPMPYYHQPPVPVSPDNSYSQMTVSPTNTLATQVEEPVVAPKLSMEPLNVHELNVSEDPHVSELERAMQALVNLSDISEVVESPEQFKSKQKKIAEQPKKSRALPPTKPSWQLGGNPSLSDIRQHSEPKREPAKEIMRTHAFDPAAAQAGMMVVYGAAAPQGFGMMQQQQQAYYYQQQQQPMYQQQPVMSSAY